MDSASPMKNLQQFSCGQLAPGESGSGVLLIDVRPLSDYSVGHIAGAFCLRLPSVLLRRFTQGKLSVSDVIVEEQRELFKFRLAKAPAIVVYDENTRDADLAEYNSKILLHVVVTCILREHKEVYFLQGGFAEYQQSNQTQQQCSQPELRHLIIPCTSDASHSSPDKAVRDVSPSPILPHLYVGSQSHAQQRDLLDKLGVTHILNITATCPNWHEGSFKYLNIAIKDTWNQRISDYFSDAFDFINSAKECGGTVLVHCVAGISRSPTFAIAYLMVSCQMTLEKATDFVKARRMIISPNLDFLCELQRFERRNLGLGVSPSTSPESDMMSENQEVPLASSRPYLPEDEEIESPVMSLCASLSGEQHFAGMREALPSIEIAHHVVPL